MISERESTPIRTMYDTWTSSPGFVPETRSLLLATPYKIIDVTNPESQSEAVAWWKERTRRWRASRVRFTLR
jgi:hypothetical protein